MRSHQEKKVITNAADALKTFNGHDSGANLKARYGEKWWDAIKDFETDLRDLLRDPAKRTTARPPRKHDNLPDLLDAMARGTDLKANGQDLICKEAALEIRDLRQSFDLRWDATMAAMKRYQAAHPGTEYTWPDHKDLVVWLLEELDRARLGTK